MSPDLYFRYVLRLTYTVRAMYSADIPFCLRRELMRSYFIAVLYCKGFVLNSISFLYGDQNEHCADMARGCIMLAWR